MDKLGLNGTIFYADQDSMVLFCLSYLFRSKGIAPHPTVMKLSLTILKPSLTILKLNLTILNLSLGGYALMNQNTTIEATENKMDHVSVISIKKGSIWAKLTDFADTTQDIITILFQ